MRVRACSHIAADSLRGCISFHRLFRPGVIDRSYTIVTRQIGECNGPVIFGRKITAVDNAIRTDQIDTNIYRPETIAIVIIIPYLFNSIIVRILVNGQRTGFKNDLIIIIRQICIRRSEIMKDKRPELNKGTIKRLLK